MGGRRPVNKVDKLKHLKGEAGGKSKSGRAGESCAGRPLDLVPTHTRVLHYKLCANDG